MADITGKIIWTGELRSGVSAQSGQNWASQDFVIEAQFQTPTGITIQRVAFNVFGNDNIAKYNLHVGDEATVHYGINAREYQGKWYNDVRAYKVENKSVAQTQAPPQQPAQQYAPAGQWQQSAPQQQYAPQQPQQNFPPQQPQQYAQQYNPGQQAQGSDGMPF